MVDNKHIKPYPGAWLNKKSAAQYLNVNTETLSKYVKQNQLPIHYIKGTEDSRRPMRRYHTSDLDKIINTLNVAKNA